MTVCDAISTAAASSSVASLNGLLPPLTAAGEAVSPFVYTLGGQLFAHALCQAKGLDPDHPRGLKKVTLTM